MSSKSKSAEAPVEEFVRPADTITIMQPKDTEDGVVRVKRELTMSFGLLLELAAVAGDFDRAQYAFMAPEVMVEFLNVALAERNARGEVIEACDSRYAGLSLDDNDAVMTWVQGHVTDFFLRRIETMEKTLLRAVPKLTRLSSSVAGSGLSNSKTQ